LVTAFLARDPLVAIDHGAEEQREHRHSDDFESDHFNLPSVMKLLALMGRLSSSFGSTSRKNGSP
jgi:hypothetical protein